MGGTAEPLPVEPDLADISPDSEGSRYRQRIQRAIPEAPFFKTIRFRLTAWYALAFILVLMALSLSLHSLLVRSLNADTQERLTSASNYVASNLNGDLEQVGQEIEVVLRGPDSNSVLLSGLWFQLYKPSKETFVMDAPAGLPAAQPELEDSLGNARSFDENRNVFRTISINGHRTKVYVRPLVIRDSRQFIGWLVVGEPLGSRESLISVVDPALQGVGFAGAILAVWGGWLLAGRALAPVNRITRMAEGIASSEGTVSLSRRLEVPTAGDELTQLAYTFNVMLDRIETAFQTQRRFVGDASHELRTPLTAVRGNVDVLLRQLKSGREIDVMDIVEELNVVQSESARMGRLIEDMLVLARSDAPTQGELLKEKVVSLEVLANEAFRTATQVATGQHLSLSIAEPITIHGDGDRLVQVMIILLDNAIRHTPAGKAINLVVDRATDTDSGRECARIRVVDEGAGIAEAHVTHIFERFYRAENARTRQSGGTGLGLSIALSIVRGHRGWIDVDTQEGEGTTFTVWLPVSQDDDVPSPSAMAPSTADSTDSVTLES